MSSHQAAAYTQYLLKREDYTPDRQAFLQERVVRTFNKLMWRFTNRPISGDALDLGGTEYQFSIAYEELTGHEAHAFGIANGADLESDMFGYGRDEFRIVCATSLIEHLHDPTNLFSETFLVLKPGGHFIIVTPHWPYCAKTFFDAYTHHTPYSHKSLRAALECHGFEVVAMVPWMVGKSDWFWTLPPPWSFRFASWLPFTGLDERKWIPKFLKGKSTSLLALARKPE